MFDCSKMSSVTLLPHIEESEVHRSVDNSISEDVADVSRASRVAQEEGPGSAEGGPTQSSSKASFSGVMAIFLLLALVASIAIWILYAYKNPHSTSGQILIKVNICCLQILSCIFAHFDEILNALCNVFTSEHFYKHSTH